LRGSVAGAPQAYRVLSFLIAGALMIAVSYAYYRFERRQEPTGSTPGPREIAMNMKLPVRLPRYDTMRLGIAASLIGTAASIGYQLAGGGPDRP